MLTETMRQLTMWFGQVFDEDASERLWRGIENLPQRVSNAIFGTLPWLFEAPTLSNILLDSVAVGAFSGWSLDFPLFKSGAAQVVSFAEATHGSLTGVIDVTAVGKSRIVTILARYVTVATVDVVDLNSQPQTEELHHGLEFRIIMGNEFTYGVDDGTPPDLTTEVDEGSIPLITVRRENDAGVQVSHVFNCYSRQIFPRGLLEHLEALSAMEEGTFFSVTANGAGGRDITWEALELLQAGGPTDYTLRLPNTDTRAWMGKAGDNILTSEMADPGVDYIESPSKAITAVGTFYVRLGVVKENGCFFPEMTFTVSPAPSDDIVLGTWTFDGVNPPVLETFDRRPRRCNTGSMRFYQGAVNAGATTTYQPILNWTLAGPDIRSDVDNIAGTIAPIDSTCYHISFELDYRGDVSEPTMNFAIHVNGVLVPSVERSVNIATSTKLGSASIKHRMFLRGGDVVQIVRRSTGAGVDFTPINGHFSVERV